MEFSGDERVTLADQIGTLLHCSFAAAIWDIMLGKFELHGVPTSPLVLLNLGLSYGRSSQLHDLWVACFASTLWFIWHCRNRVRHDGLEVTVSQACRLITSTVAASSRLSSGCMFNTVQELCVIKGMGAICKPRRAPRIIEVN